MKVAALILGIIGGLIGLAVAVFELLVGGIGGAVGSEGSGTVTILGFAAMAVAILAIIGAALSLAKPRLAALIMLLAGIAGFVTSSAFWIISGVLLLVGALLAFLGRAPRAVTDIGVEAGPR